MMVYILLISLFAVISVITEAQLHPIQTQDLNSIVESVKKDVDRHLQMTSAGRRIKSVSLPDPPELRKTSVVTDIEGFMKMIQDSMHHHLVRNLGPPSDAEHDETTSYSKPGTKSPFVTLRTASAHDQPSDLPLKNTDEDTLESSSEVYEIRVGSTKGVPGVHFPNYTDIPITSFTCSDKADLPGFYADLETGCQVFHVCWPERRESFLCPMGTIFNQALSVCDYWYNSNCSLAPYYYTVNSEIEPDSSSDKEENESSMINVLLEKTNSGSALKPDSSSSSPETAASVLSFVSRFMPIKAKIVIYPETASQRAKIVASASIGQKNIAKSKSRTRSKFPATSKLSKVSLSKKHGELPKDTRLDEFKAKIFAVKFYQALDRILMDVKSDNSLLRLLWYVEKTVNFMKEYLEDYMRELPEPDNIEQGSELYEYHSVTTEAFEKLPALIKKFLKHIADFLDEFDRRMKIQENEVPHETHEPEDFNHVPQTHLNPRFIVKPANELSTSFENQDTLSTPVEEKRVRREANVLKLSNSDRLNIYAGTKKALLKNYIKLFKTKHS